MSEESPSLHPYDVLAHPKRRRILGFLAENVCTYSDLMRETRIEDSGSLSYHLGVLSRYIQHDKDLYSLSIDGKVLWGAVKEFEKRSYGLVGSMTMSSVVQPDGKIKISYSMKFSMMTALGDKLGRKPGDKYDPTKANTAIQSRADGPGISIQGVTTDWDKDGFWIAFEQEFQGYVEKDGWMVGNSSLEMANMQRSEDDDKTFSMVPGLHLQIRVSALYPRGAVVVREYPDRSFLEQEGLKVYEFSTTETSSRWRVGRGSVLCLGESRLENDGDNTREIAELETHVLVKGEDPELVPQIQDDMKSLPILVSGNTKFKIKTNNTTGDV